MLYSTKKPIYQHTHQIVLTHLSLLDYEVVSFYTNELGFADVRIFFRRIT